MRITKKIIAFILILVLVTGIVGMVSSDIPVSASIIPSGMSSQYKSGKYYDNLVSALYKYANASQPDRLVGIALSQKGYMAGTSKTDIAGNGNGSKRFCEYTEWISNKYPKNGDKRGLDWCASFVSWCAYMAGIPTSVIPHSAGTGTYRSCGTQHKIWSDDFKTYIDYQPKKGDLMLAMPYTMVNGQYKHYNGYDLTAHVAIVAEDGKDYNSSEGWHFTTIERVSGNKVGSRDLFTKENAGGVSEAGTHYVQMFVTPNYQASDRTPPTDGSISIYSDDFRIGHEVKITLNANNVSSFNMTVRDGVDTSKVLLSNSNVTGPVSFYPEYNGRYEVWVDSLSPDGGFLGMKDSFMIQEPRTENSYGIKQGDVLLFGSYEQDNDLGNGTEPIEWIVLSADDDKALLLSRYGLAGKPYDSYEDLEERFPGNGDDFNWSTADITWENSELRAWLNNEFFDAAFSSYEKLDVLDTFLTNPDEPEYGTKGGNDTWDRVFLLTHDDIKNPEYGFSADIAQEDINRRCSATEYAVKTDGVVTLASYYQEEADKDGWKKYATAEGETPVEWWLRSPGSQKLYIADVHYYGFSYYSCPVFGKDLAVRPAIYLDLSTERHWSKYTGECNHTWEACYTEAASALKEGAVFMKCSKCGGIKRITIPKVETAPKLNSKNISIYQEDSFRLVVSDLASEDRVESIESSDTSIIKIEDAGDFSCMLISTGKIGTVNVTVMLASGKKESCVVNVVSNPSNTAWNGNVYSPLNIKVGDTLKFGSYEQDNVIENGSEPIDWTVLSIEGDKALLLSKYALDGKPYNDYDDLAARFPDGAGGVKWEDVYITWANCTLRSWLNSEFYGMAFSETEKRVLLERLNVNLDNPYYGVNGGNDTNDKVFLLSLQELINPGYGFLPDHNEYDIMRSCTATPYAKSHGVMTLDDWYEDWIESESKTVDGEPPCDGWHLRTPGKNNARNVMVSLDGDITDYGLEVSQYFSPIDDICYEAVRPAIYINLNAYATLCSGEIDNPSGSAASEKSGSVLNVVIIGQNKIVAGTTAQFDASVTVSGNADRNVVWSSQNTGIATVSNSGVVKAVKPGVTTIYATSSDGKTEASQVLYVIPTKHKSLKVTQSSKKVTAKWKKQNGVSGYQIQYGTSASFSKKKSKTLDSDATSFTFKASKKKTYYVRIRSYVLIGSQKYYGAWKKVKIKVK